MVDQPEKKPRRRTRKPAAKKTSKIQQAQSDARNTLATLGSSKPISAAQQKANAASVAAAQKKNPQGFISPMTNQPVATPPEGFHLGPAQGYGPPGSSNVPKQADGIGAITQRVQPQGSSLANPSLYGTGGVNAADIKARIDARRAALNSARNSLLTKQGNGVYMGPMETRPGSRRGEGDFEGGQFSMPESITIDKVVSKDQLMAWLSDETIFNQVKRRMIASGNAVQSYNDVAQLWKSVLDQAAATYSVTHKKITPWALLELRGKQNVNGKPAARTTTQTTIDELDPAQARMLFEDTVSKYLGRGPTHAELDDFISKAQLIARNNPDVAKTTTQYDFAGNPTSSVTHHRGGAAATSAQLQAAAEDIATQAEDYGSTQAAGTLFPWLIDALGPAVG